MRIKQSPDRFFIYAQSFGQFNIGYACLSHGDIQSSLSYCIRRRRNHVLIASRFARRREYQTSFHVGGENFIHGISGFILGMGQVIPLRD